MPVFDTKRRPLFSALHDLFDGQTAEEALAKLKAYEEQQKADEIKVGDDVLAPAGNAVVLAIFKLSDGSMRYRYMYTDGSYGIEKVGYLQKTGHHFPEVAQLLERMKEGAE